MDPALQNLEIAAIVLAALCGLFGVYLVLFILAVWSTFRRPRRLSKRLRVVTIIQFLTLTAHFIARSLQFYRARVIPTPENEMLKWSIPLLVIGNVTTTFAGLLSDGVLAWRFYVIYGGKRWALYIPATAVIVNAFLCWSADMQHLTAYTNMKFYEDTLLEVTLDITVAWGWLMFTINSLLTGAIFARIFFVARGSASMGAIKSSRLQYRTVMRAIIESALVTWIGLLVYEIASLAPSGHVTTNLDVGYVMESIIPVFFGISQCLIISRIGFTKETDASTEYTTDYTSHRFSVPLHVGGPRVPKVQHTETSMTNVDEMSNFQAASVAESKAESKE